MAIRRSEDDASVPAAHAPASAPWKPLLSTFGRIGLLSFGGPAGQIALMHRELVERRAWLSERQFLDALGFCMLLPGPEAMQLCTFAGWRLRGVPGGLAAGLLFVLPGAVVVTALAFLYAAFGDLPAADAMLLGVQAAVVVIIVQALWRLSRKAIDGWRGGAVAAAGFLAFAVLGVPFFAVIVLAGLFGVAFMVAGEPAEPADASAAGEWRASLPVIGLWLAIWLFPFLLLLAILPDSRLTAIFAYFAQLAIVSFGGAYALLGAMTDTIVRDFGWLTTGQMIDALGLAETTMGPLILVTTFVGTLAMAGPAGFDGPAMLAGAAVSLWATFVPSFLFIFAGAPHIDRLARDRRIAGALAAIRAVIVGIIAHLGLWFGGHVFLGDDFGFRRDGIADLDLTAIGLAVAAAILLMPLRLPLLAVVPAMAGAGLLAAAFLR